VVDDLEHVWKALSDPTRRRILDLIRDEPRTTGWLAEQFPALSRFAVMKHLGVLEGAGLVLVRRRGRERWNYLNAVPLRQIYERWMGPYAELWSSSLLRLKDHVERDNKPPAGGANDENSSGKRES
jgi:DNA-binding transcriptional ArsR family regulator